MISIVEVGPRDGLQNEKTKLSLATRQTLVKKLVAAGERRIEIGAFVSPKWVPQMAGSGLLIKKLTDVQNKKKIAPDIQFSGLIPNMHGMTDAIDSGLSEVAIFTAASEAFSKKNINCTIDESFQRFEDVMAIARERKIRVRGYLSTCFYCPYTGKVDRHKVVDIVNRLLKIGCYEVSIGDTIGAATPNEVRALLKDLIPLVGVESLAMHFHDTRGTALANILASLDLGIETFDSSIGGLGGCPYAPGAAGNVATEDVVFLLEQMGCPTGIDLKALIKINKWLSKMMKRELPSKVSKAGLMKM